MGNKISKGIEKAAGHAGRSYRRTFIILCILTVFVYLALAYTLVFGATLRYSYNQDYSSSALLHNAVISGPVYIWAAPTTADEEKGITSILFKLNGVDGLTERAMPYDFQGGGPKAWLTTEVNDGPHLIQAVATLNDGTENWSRADFTIANNTASGDDMFNLPINIVWDADDTPANCPDDDCPMRWESIRFYTRFDNETFDFTKSFYELSQSYQDGKSIPTSVELTTPVKMYAVNTKWFVLRSAARVGEQLIESEDSDPVSFTADLTRPAKVNLAVTLNKASDTIDFAWDFIDDARVDRYSVQMSDTEGTGYKNIAIVKKEDIGMEPKLSVPRDQIFPDGQTTTKHFVVVSITKPDWANIYSRWSPFVNLTYMGSPPNINRPKGLLIDLK